MFVNEIVLKLIDHWVVVLVVVTFSLLATARYQKGLSAYPGPFIASFTDLWHVFDAVRDPQRNAWKAWHERYGDVVRIAPNKLSFADPKVIADMFGPGKDFRKSDFYFVSAATAHGKATPSLFSTLDKPYHDRIKRAVNSAFSLSSLVKYEPYIDHVIQTWLHEVGSRFADTGTVCNLARWLHYYSLDVIGKVVYGQQYGFLERGEDVDDMIRDTSSMLRYAHWAGLAPWLDKLFKKNPIKMSLARHGLTRSTVNPAVVAALKQQDARGLGLDASVNADTEKAIKDPHDLLDQFVRAKQEHPKLLSNREILMLGISMVFAGSDTTAWSLSAFFYYVLRTPGVYEKLTSELRARTSGTIVPYAVAKDLPYLDACIKETFRMHPAGRFASERVVPPGGAQVGCHYIAGGTVVAVNPWVIHRRRDIWGEDVDTFRPERWLENEVKSKKMAGMLFQFGAGNFVCLGRNVSLLEMYKITVAALKSFEFELEDAKQEWTLLPGSFAGVESVNVRLRRREVR